MNNVKGKKGLLGILVLFLVLLLVYVYFSSGARGKTKDELTRTIRVENITPQFKPYIVEAFEDGPQIVEIVKRDPVVSFRTVITNKGEEKISVREGYRVLYAYGGFAPLVKMHVEQSQTGEYPSDRHKAIDQVENLSGGIREVEQEKGENWESYSIESDQIGGSIVGMRVMFFPKDNIILTVYFLNQPEGEKQFETLEQYQELKKNFILKLMAYLLKSL